MLQGVGCFSHGVQGMSPVNTPRAKALSPNSLLLFKSCMEHPHGELCPMLHIDDVRRNISVTPQDHWCWTCIGFAACLLVIYRSKHVCFHLGFKMLQGLIHLTCIYLLYSIVIDVPRKVDYVYCTLSPGHQSLPQWPGTSHHLSFRCCSPSFLLLRTWPGPFEAQAWTSYSNVQTIAILDEHQCF